MTIPPTRNNPFQNTYINVPSRLSGLMTVGVILFVLACFLLLFGTRSVDAGEHCVRLRFGDVAGTAGPGLHFVVPFSDSFKCYSTRIVVYEVTANPSDSGADFVANSAEFNTPDGQEAKANFTVIWRIRPEDVECVYRETGRDMTEVNERAVAAITRSRVRLLSGRFTATQLFSGRLDPTTDVDITDTTVRTVIETLEEEISADIVPRLAEKCVTLDDFLLRKYDFDEDFVTSRELLRSAEADAEREVTIAQGKANAARIEADGQADALRTVADVLATYSADEARFLLQFQFLNAFGDNITFGLVPEGLNPFIEIPIVPSEADTADPQPSAASDD